MTAGIVFLWAVVCLGALVLWLGYRIVEWLATPSPPVPVPIPPEPKMPTASRSELAQDVLAVYTEDLMLAELVDDEQLRKAMQREAKAKLARALKRIQEMAGRPAAGKPPWAGGRP